MILIRVISAVSTPIDGGNPLELYRQRGSRTRLVLFVSRVPRRSNSLRRRLFRAEVSDHQLRHGCSVRPPTGPRAEMEAAGWPITSGRRCRTVIIRSSRSDTTAPRRSQRGFRLRCG